jgi:outer membrane protein assembly factor BamB
MKFHSIDKLALMSVCLFVAFSGLRAMAQPIRNQDWPQWGGLRRDFKSDSTSLADRWPARGPQRLWSRPLGEGHSAIVAEYGGTFLHLGYSSSPIVYKNTLVVQVGGAGRALMAFDLNNGRVTWLALNYTNSYSSPIIINVDGQDQLVTIMRDEIIGVDPNNGAFFWSHPISAQWNFHFTISTPVWGPGNLLFASAAYGIGGRVLRLSRSGGKTVVNELWKSERTRVHKENAIRVGDVIYASTGHIGPAFFTAIDVKSGRVLWQDRRFSHASFLYADGRFIILDEDGALGLATPAPEGLTVHSKIEMLTSRSWTVPTLVGKTLILRDRKNVMALGL